MESIPCGGSACSSHSSVVQSRRRTRPRAARCGVHNGRHRDGVFTMTFARNGALIHLVAGDYEVSRQAQIAEPVEPERAGITDADWPRRTVQLYQAETVPWQVIAATSRLHPAVN